MKSNSSPAAPASASGMRARMDQKAGPTSTFIFIELLLADLELILQVGPGSGFAMPRARRPNW